MWLCALVLRYLTSIPDLSVREHEVAAIELLPLLGRERLTVTSVGVSVESSSE